MNCNTTEDKEEEVGKDKESGQILEGAGLEWKDLLYPRKN